MNTPIVTTVVLALGFAALPAAVVRYAASVAADPELDAVSEPATTVFRTISVTLAEVGPAVSAPPTLAAMEPTSVVGSAPPQDVDALTMEELVRLPQSTVGRRDLVEALAAESVDSQLVAESGALARELMTSPFRTLDEVNFGIEDLGGSILVGDAIGFDFGSGIPAYDEAAGSYDVLPDGRSGFSDSLLQLSWQKSLAPGATLVGTMAATRFQDVAVLESLSEPDLAWVSVGLRFSF